MAAPTSERIEAQRALGRALRRSSRLAHCTLDATVSSLDLNFTQWSVLRILKDAGEVQVGDLARAMEMTGGAMTRLIDALEQRGLASRRRSQSDRRLVKVLSTSAGNRLLEEAAPGITATWTDLLAPFDTDEIDMVTSLLSRLVTVLEQRTASGNALMESLT